MTKARQKIYNHECTKEDNFTQINKLYYLSFSQIKASMLYTPAPNQNTKQNTEALTFLKHQCNHEPQALETNTLNNHKKIPERCPPPLFPPNPRTHGA